MTRGMFAGFDLGQFWEPSGSPRWPEYVGASLTDEAVAKVERELGYTLPASYVELMRYQNGGIPRRRNHRTKERTSWRANHIAITGIYSIGGEKRCSLCGDVGSRFWHDEWGYPDIGVYLAACPSGGHDMVFFELPDVRADRGATSGACRSGVGL